VAEHGKKKHDLLSEQFTVLNPALIEFYTASSSTAVFTRASVVGASLVAR